MTMKSFQRYSAIALILAKPTHAFCVPPSSLVTTNTGTSLVGGLDRCVGRQRNAIVESGSRISSAKWSNRLSDNDMTVEQTNGPKQNFWFGLSFDNNNDDDPKKNDAIMANELGQANRLSLMLVQTKDILSPAAEALDGATDGWALSYADLAPESETSPVGQAFLATNIGYALVGILLAIQGETVLGLLTELASVASFIYHYTQLQKSAKRADDSTVRLALMVDYVFALSSILVGLLYIVSDGNPIPTDGLISGGLGIFCLFACWVWEQGLTYILLHSFWHFFSAYTGYVIGISHVSA